MSPKRYDPWGPAVCVWCGTEIPAGNYERPAMSCRAPDCREQYARWLKEDERRRADARAGVERLKPRRLN